MIPLTKENLESALEEIHSYDADMGGTQILNAMRFVYNELLEKNKGDMSQQLFILTDGAVMNTEYVI